MGELKELKWPVGEEKIKKALEDANISFDPELDRRALWKAYKKAKKMQEDVPAPSVEEAQDSGEKTSESNDSTIQPQTLLDTGTTVETETEVTEPAKEVEEVAAVQTQDSQTDSVPSNEAHSTPDLERLRNDASIVLKELSPYQAAITPILRYAKSGNRDKCARHQVIAADNMHDKLYQHIRYNKTQHGVIVASFKVLFSLYEGEHDLAQEWHDTMITLLLKKAENVSSATLRYAQRGAPNWITVALKYKN